jgi:hypothetical protein
MTGLILAIAVLVTGTIVPNVEAAKPDKGTGKPPTDDSESGINFSCKAGKGKLNCKASSRNEIDYYTMKFPDGGGFSHTGTCQRSQPFADDSIETGVYEVYVRECITGNTYEYEITVDSNFKITSTVQV